MARKLKNFLEGCVAMADGLERAQEAFGGRRNNQREQTNQFDGRREDPQYRNQGPDRSPRQFIDIPPGAERMAPLQGQDPQGQGLDTRRTEMQVTHKDVRSIDERVAYIVGMIQKGRDSAEVREFAVKAISQRCGDGWCVTEGDGEAEVRALFHAAQKVYRYCGDTYGKDLFQHPARTLQFGGGDCDDATILICSALGAVGFATKCRVIRTKNAKEWNHIYALVGLPQKSPSKWVALDLSVSTKPPGWQPPREMIAQIKDFDVPVAR